MIYDKDIREPLFDFLEDSFGKVRILEEKRLCILPEMWNEVLIIAR